MQRHFARRCAALAVFLAVAASGCLAGQPVRPPMSPDMTCLEPCVRPVAPGVEPFVAVDPRDPQHIMVGTVGDGGTSVSAVRFGYGWNYAHMTWDGGRTWETTPLPAGPTDGPRGPLASARVQLDPQVTFLPDGSILYTGLSLQQVKSAPSTAGSRAEAVIVEGVRIFAARSVDGGRSFPELAIVAEESGPYLVLACAGGPSTPRPCVGEYGMFPAPDFPRVAMGRDGALLMVWRSDSFRGTSNLADACTLDPSLSWAQTCESTRIMFARSNDGGQTWSTPRRTIDQPCYSASPAVTGDGVLRFACAETVADGARRILLAESTDAGATWRSHPTINVSDLEPEPHLQGWPHGGPDGLALAFASPTVTGCGSRPAVTFSEDGGRTWSEALALRCPGEETLLRIAFTVGSPASYVAHYHASSADGAREYRIVSIDSGGGQVVTTLDPDAAPAGSYYWDYTTAAATGDGAAAVWMHVGAEDTVVNLALVAGPLIESE